MAPARGNLPLRIQASGGRALIHSIVELDPATAKQPEWAGGGTLRVVIEPAPGSKSAAQTINMEVAAGQRAVIVSGIEPTLAPGRYTVRAELTPIAAHRQ